jgi:uncharacterized membrane protein YcaP (DUF421 family)
MEWIDAAHRIVGEDGERITLAQMTVRAVVVFLVGLVLVRVTTQRTFSKATPLDILLSIIIGSNLSRTMTGNAPLFDVIVATAALVALHAALRHLTARWDWLARIVKGKPTVIVRDGEVDRRTMRRCAVGRRELDAAVRAAGGTEVGDVRLASIERDGSIDVVLK